MKCEAAVELIKLVQYTKTSKKLLFVLFVFKHRKQMLTISPHIYLIFLLATL